MIRWAVEEELVSGQVYQGLRAVAGLRAGKSEARETRKVTVVPAEHVDAALPFMPPVVQAMVRLQLLSGCRPCEICMLRAVDVDRTDPECWVYRPGSDAGREGRHKTAHHGHERLILLGPQAQEILRPYLVGEPSSFCFQLARPGAGRRRAEWPDSSTATTGQLLPAPPSQPREIRRAGPSEGPDLAAVGR